MDKAKQADVSDRTKRRKLLNVLDEVGELYELQMGRVKAGETNRGSEWWQEV